MDQQHGSTDEWASGASSPDRHVVPADASTGRREDPWVTVSSREVYRNPWLRVREDEVVRPDGRPGIYGVVSMHTAVGVVALTDQDEVVLVGQWRYTLDAYSWELVEGGVDPDEDADAAISRELAEEAGYRASEWELLVDDVALSNSVTDERARLYVARGLSAVTTDPDPTEVLEVSLVPFRTALRMVDAGEITDSMTIIGLLALDRRRRA